MPKLDLTKIFGSKLVVSDLELSTCTIPENIQLKILAMYLIQLH